MLNAILNSKSGRLGKEAEYNTNWRELFRGSEDLITATLFERLSYLPGKTAWQILVAAAGGRLRPYRVAEIKLAEFWPMWPLEQRQRGVEPDIFLELSLGDPEKKVHVIVEAKHGARQFARQLGDELRAWIEVTEEGELPDQIVVLAIGGLPSDATKTKLQEDFYEEIEDIDTETLPELLFLPMDWGDLAQSISTHIASTPHEKRLVADMSAALALFGYFHITPSSQLELLLSHRRIDPEVLSNLMGHNLSSQDTHQ